MLEGVYYYCMSHFDDLNTLFDQERLISNQRGYIGVQGKKPV